MRRREFISLLTSAVAWPLAARAQQVSRVRRVCVLMGLAARDPGGQAQAGAFKHGLQELGWTEGQNVRIEYRWTAGDIALTQTLAKELIDLAPDVLLATNTPTLETLQQAIRTIPIVFVGVEDPVGQGFIKSLAHPDGNVTGFMLFEFSLGTKWLALLKELVPGLSRVAIMFNPETAPFSGNFLRPLEAVASSFAVELTAAPVQDDVEIERALVSLGREPRGGLIALPEIFLGSRGTACFRRSVARSRACRCGYACRRRRAGRPRWLWFGVPDRCGCRPRGVTRCAIESAPDAVRDNRCGHEVHKGFSSCRSSAHIGAVHPCVEG
jgi:ABC transporter substrate binding protein